EMPKQCGGEAEIVVHALGALVVAADRKPDREAQELEQRLLVVDAPAAADQDDDAERPGPVGVADPARMQDHSVLLCAHLGAHGSTLLAPYDGGFVWRRADVNRRNVIVIVQAAL